MLRPDQNQTTLREEYLNRLLEYCGCTIEILVGDDELTDYILSEFLAEHVNNVFDVRASSVNNSGVAEQASFLLHLNEMD